jgi:excisionase family DNA binding protein
MATMASNAPALLRIDDAAKTLSVCKRTVFELISGGQLRAFKLRGCTLIRRQDLDSYIASLKPVRARFAA